MMLRRELVSLALLVAGVYAAHAWWQQHHADSTGERVAALAGPGDIVMLSSASCGYCEQARRWLLEHRVVFSECFIESDTACAARYQSAGGAGTPTLLVRGQRQLGFNAGAVAQALGDVR